MENFALGLIEGFYGRQWSWDERKGMADFLGAEGYTHYIYAPKGDKALRSKWREPFDAQWLRELRRFGEHCHAAGLSWGLGLSPMGLQAAYSPSDREVLRRIIDQLNALNPDLLWLLFDDMRGDHAQLADNQCAVSADVSAAFSGALAVCPSYYSSDPILDEVFGPRPANYLQDLSAGLNPEVDILWTGKKVISDALDASDCDGFLAETGRKPLLWDNYPVNDGRKTSGFLHLNAFQRRSPILRERAAGHFVNPMNQAELSKLALSSLPRLYADPNYDADVAREAALSQLPPALAELLRRDWSRFQVEGLASLSAEQSASLRADYACCDHPAAREVEAWLAGDYTFDPDCLTE